MDVQISEQRRAGAETSPLHGLVGIPQITAARRSEFCGVGGVPLVVAYGGGVNSTAMLCGFRECDVKPDMILFADTGGETPETYEHVAMIGGVVREWWGMELETVRKLYQGRFEGLEGNCLRKTMLPSLAYGKKGCSQKYKIEPQQRRLKQLIKARGAAYCVKAIGYDAGEGHRVKRGSPDGLESFWYPLVEWQWRRRECVEAILRHGLPEPPKSACFFCPANKRGEILRLRETHPELYERALAIERNAVTTDLGRGLAGSSGKWEDIVNADDDQMKLIKWVEQHDPQPIPCGCYDG